MEEHQKAFFQALNKNAIVPWDPKVDLMKYYYSATQLRRQAAMYRKQAVASGKPPTLQDAQKRYILLMRYITLVVEHLPKHPSYNQPSFATKKMEVRSECVSVMTELERIQQYLESQFQERYMKMEEAKAKAEADAAAAAEAKAAAEAEAAAAEARAASAAAAAAAAAAAGAAWAAPVSEETKFGELIDVSEPKVTGSAAAAGAAAAVAGAPPSHYIASNPAPGAVMGVPVGVPTGLPVAARPPPPPTAVSTPIQKPPPPEYSSLYPDPSGMMFDDPASDALRRVRLPGEILEAFLKCADRNTQRAIETCAILAGTIEGDKLHVTALIVPLQEGTRDTCSTVDEESLFNELDTRNLLCLGWIHTHPTQSAFLSSVDLHMHASYQGMLAEAIAVVMAPTSHPNHGIFRLTNPPGLSLIQNCTLGGFHPHDKSAGALFQDCDHVDVVWGQDRPVIVDMRLGHAL
eukprot:CAMPEP_0114549548 /NCGR_PEP_ID=MMETSP0114-20121206/5582_1 /TAXON_ID=31324 /ORGANISM="Goniomonas sp, Strain m" /LENGTH=461 /DNA_ID=CAMNT_0001734229 /DNA_START=153 /DNA_END=1539 /DNA_ORIENTATION=-